MGNMQQGANEVMYKIASHLLSKMQESGLISEEEREKINEEINKIIIQKKLVK